MGTEELPPACLGHMAYAYGEEDAQGQEGAVSVCEGEKVVVLEEHGEWSYVQVLSSSRQGFVPSSFVEKDGGVTVHAPLPPLTPPCPSPPPPSHAHHTLNTSSSASSASSASYDDHADHDHDGKEGGKSPATNAHAGPLSTTQAAVLYLVALVVMVAVAVAVAAGGGDTPLSQAELLGRAQGVLDKAEERLLVRANGTGGANGTAAELRLVIGADGGGVLDAGAAGRLFGALGLGAGARLDLLVEVEPRAGDWAVGFPNRGELCPGAGSQALANGSAAPADPRLLDGLPVRVFRSNATLLEGLAAPGALVALYVGELAASPRVEVAVRLELAANASALEAPSLSGPLGGAATWLGELDLEAGGSLVVSTGSFATEGFEVRAGTNARLEASGTGGAGTGSFLDEFFAQVEGTTSLGLSGFVPWEEAEAGARFDVLARGGTLRLPSAGASAELGELSLRAFGLSLPPVRAEAMARLALGGDTGERVVLGAGGAWDAASGALEWDACSREVVLPSVAPYFVLDRVRGRARLLVDSGNTRVDFVEASGEATLPPVDGGRAEVHARFDGGEPPSFSVLGAAELGGARGLSQALCAYLNHCDPVPALDQMGLDDLRVVAAVSTGTAGAVVRGTPVPRGVSAWGEADAVTLPSELAPVADLLGLPARPAAVAGFTAPLDAPLDFYLFLAFRDAGTARLGGGAGGLADVVRVSEVRAELRPLPVPTASLGLTVLVDGLADEALAFTARASVTAAASVVLEGFLDGAWHNVGGLRGLDATHVGGSFGVALGGAVTEVGVYGTFDFGPSTSAEFTVLLSAARGKFAVQANVTNLSVGALAEFVEQTSGFALPRGVAGALEALLQTDIRRLDVLIAPVAVEVGPRVVPQGFHAHGEGTLLGADFEVDVGSFDRRLEVAPGVYRDVPDFTVGFEVGGFGLGDLSAALRLGDFVLGEIRREIDDRRRLCCCGTPITPAVCASLPVGDITRVVERISDGLNSVFEVEEFSLSQFNVSDVLRSSAGNPTLAMRATVAGREVSLERKLPISWFARSASDAAAWIWGEIKSATTNFLPDLAKLIMGRFCSLINSLCLDLKATKVCINIPGVCP